jgi:methyltransferase (TIGR00027 family)
MDLIRNISDTARWVAIYRAQETERPDALFRDPYARRLAGDLGEQIADSIDVTKRNSWSFLARTYLFDRFISEQVQAGVDMVVNLAAGLDARPYRMDLPPSLKWIEVDLPEILEYKEEILANDTPVCSLERVALDLSDVDARRNLFAGLGKRANKVMIVSEGLIVYFTAAEVAALAEDLAATPSFGYWAFDLASPGLLKMLQKKMPQLDESGTPLKFGPPEGPGFFVPHGWKPLEVCSFLKTAAQLKRLPFFLRLISFLPASNGTQGSRPWAAGCLMKKVL